MKLFLMSVRFLVAVGVVIAAVSNYLIINKLWKRRMKKDVAESISLGAALLGLATGLPFFFQFTLIDHTPLPAAKQAIGILTAVVLLLIGSGTWVRENRGKRFSKLFVRALNLERHESADLIKTLIQPKGAEHILGILEQLARVDRRIDEREIALIHDFAHRWKLDPPALTAGEVAGAASLVAVRDAMLDYLALKPPPEQASDLMDLLRVFVRVDTEVSEEEETVVEELNGVMAQYLNGEGQEPTTYEVVIVPQSEQQVDAVRSLIPGAELKPARGGRVFSVGRFFSSRYAEVVCGRYIALGLFTTHVEVEPQVAGSR
ncbi:MAG: hypothetical protein P8099_06660 [Gemmatimonadota bacterium]|jgi:hypothetical protein